MTRYLAAAVLCLWASTASAQVLFTMNMASGADPLAGFGNIAGAGEIGVVVTRTRVAGAGPNGQAVYRWAFRHDPNQMTSATGYGGEHYLGWQVTAGPAPSSGQSRFSRFRFRVSSDSNFRAIDSATGGSSQIIHKLLILGDGGRGRTIISVHGDVGSGQFFLHIGRDGGAEINLYPLQRGVWYDLQVETITGTGGGLKAWVNTDTYGAPTAVATGLDMGGALYAGIGFGFYNNRMLAVGGIYAVDLTDFEYATTFDAGWSAGDSTPLPGRPANLRILPGVIR